jgi:hypothetical protein
VQGYREWEYQGTGDGQGRAPGNGLCVSCWTLMMDTQSAAALRESGLLDWLWSLSGGRASRPNLAAQSHTPVLRIQTLFILNGWHALKSRLWRGSRNRDR